MDANQAEMNEMINALQMADETLYQSNHPDDEINLSDRLLKSPVFAIQAIEQRGWEKRGPAEEGNRFAIRVLARMINEGDAATAEKALDALVGVFATPDDNTTGWQGMLELAGAPLWAPICQGLMQNCQN